MVAPLSAEEVAKRLKKPGPSGDGWHACCPVHDDKKPSLVLYDGRYGVVARCMAGCPDNEVRAALTSLGLLPERRRLSRDRSKPQKTAVSGGANELPIIWPVPPSAPSPAFEKLLGWKPTGVHLYLDPKSQPLFMVARRDHAEGKDIRPLTLRRRPDGGLVWQTRGPPEPRPLYGLDRLAAKPDAIVLVVEGEKTADAASHRLPNHAVVSWSGGANAVEMTDWTHLAGRDVILWPDNDAPGRRAMDRLAELLRRRPQ